MKTNFLGLLGLAITSSFVAVSILVMPGCNKKEPASSYESEAYRKASEEAFDRLSAKIERMEDNTRKRDSAIIQSVSKQASIVNNFKSVYEKINSAGDNNSAQLSITDSLLAKHRGLVLERD